MEKMKVTVSSIRKKGLTGASSQDSGSQSKLLGQKERTVLFDNMTTILAYLLNTVNSNDILWEKSFAGVDADSISTIGSDGKALPVDSAISTAKNIVSKTEKGGRDGLIHTLEECSKDAIASVIKLYFQSCDVPLVPAAVCLQMSNLKDASTNIEGLKVCLGGIPDISILGLLCTVLNRIGSSKHKLSYTFGPLVFLPRFDSQTFSKNSINREVYDKMDILRTTASVVKVMEVLISRCDEVFVDLVPAKAFEKPVATVARIPVQIATKPNKLPIVAAKAQAPPKKAPVQLPQARIEFGFDAEGPNEMSVTEGEIVEILEQGGDGWWLARSIQDGVTQGLVPADYCILLPPEEMIALHPPVPEQHAYHDDSDDDDHNFATRGPAPTPYLSGSGDSGYDEEPDQEPSGIRNPNPDLLSMKQQLLDLLHDLQAEQYEKECLLEENRNMKVDCQRLEQELQAAKKVQTSNDNSTRKELFDARAKLESAERAAQSAKDAEAAAKRQLSDFQGKNKNLEAQLQQSHADVARLHDQIAELMREKDELKKHIESLKISQIDAKIAETRAAVERNKNVPSDVSSSSSSNTTPRKAFPIPPSIPNRTPVSAPRHDDYTEKEYQSPSTSAAVPPPIPKQSSSAFSLPTMSVTPSALKRTPVPVSSPAVEKPPVPSPSSSIAATSAPTVGEKRAAPPSRFSFTRKSASESPAPTPAPAVSAPARPSVTSASSSASSNNDKYEKMRKMGLPEEAILHAMARDKAASGDNSGSSHVQAPPAPTQRTSVPRPAPPQRPSLDGSSSSSNAGYGQSKPSSAAPFRLPAAPMAFKPSSMNKQ